MPRDQKVDYEQDRLGNERRKLDQLRAQEGMEGEDDNNGIAAIGADDVGANVVLYELPEHADQIILTELHAYNSTTEDGTYSLFEVEIDDQGAITSSVRRSVPIEVVGEATRINSYQGLPFEGHIAVTATFEGHVGAGVIADHKQSSN